MNQTDLLKGIKTKSIISLCLIFTLIGIIASFILDIICAIQILSTTWENKEVNESKTIWGILTLIFLGPIASLIFSTTSINKINYQNNSNLETKEDFVKEENNVK